MISSREIFNFIFDGDEESAVANVTSKHLSAHISNSKNYLIHLAVQHKLDKLVAKLITLGADPYQLNDENENAFSLSVRHEDPTIFLHLLNIKINPTSDIGSAILTAFEDETNDEKKSQIIIKKLCQKTDRKVLAEAFSIWNNDGNQALHLAVKKRNHAVIKTLTEYGANPYTLNNKKQNALSLAVKKNDLEALTILLTTKHPAISDIGYAILGALLEDKVEFLEPLLQKAGKELATQIFASFKVGAKKRSALHLAVKNNSPKTVELLMAFGAKTEQTDDEGMNVYSYAAKKGFSNLLSQPADTRDKKSQTKSTDSSNLKDFVQEFTSKDKDEYNHFVSYIKKNNFHMDDAQCLGNVAVNDPDLYFAESETSIQNGIAFLDKFFSKEKNRQDVIDIQQQKSKTTTPSNQNNMQTQAAIISFVSFTLHQKKYCLIAASGWKHMSKLDFNETIASLNNNQIEYFIVQDGEYIAKINILLKKVSNQSEQRTKACAEKPTLKILMKLLVNYGSDLQIDGMSNFSFYPYEYQKGYGIKAVLPVDAEIVEILPHNRVQINDRFYSQLVPCCSECKDNKKAGMAILTAAQQIGDEYNRGRSRDRNTKREFNPSPIRLSGITANSELHRYSHFKGKKSQNIITGLGNNSNDNNNATIDKKTKRGS